MATKQPLVRRIIIAFVLMTFVVGSVFSISIFEIVHYIEEQLVSKELEKELDFVIHQHPEQYKSQTLGTHMHFFSSDSDAGIPESFAAVKAGFTEVTNKEGAFYVFKRVTDGAEYLMVEDQTEFEAREDALYQAVFAGFLLSLLAAWTVGSIVAKRVISPVLRLAQQVGQLDERIGPAPAMAAEYADDEVGDLAKAFDHSLGQLSSSLMRERFFTSDVSHELRTPLMIIASSCELMLASGKLAPIQHTQLTRIHRAAQEMADLVQTFLMLARADKAESLMGGNTTLADAAENQRERWTAAFAAKGLEFVVQGMPDSSRHYNATFLNTVISNLLRNALDYTQAGMVRLILTENGFTVEDTGAGIPADQQEKVFQPFVRGAVSPGEGLGLGLSLVKRICDREGWQVQVEAAFPRGSIFRIKLIH
jgi:signal transduction histidine kinase